MPGVHEMRRRWACARCGKSGTTKIEARVVFHPCVVSRPPRRRIGLGDGFPETMEERRRALFATIALGADPSKVRFKANPSKARRAT